MKLLFLDLDGVANNHAYNETSQSTTFLPRCVDQLNRIIEATDCRLVLSSAWRYMLIGRAMTLCGFEYLLRSHGVAAQGRLVGMTPADEEWSQRESQIKEFLRGRVDVDGWCVLDDLPLMLYPEQWRFVRVDGSIGLTEKDADRAIAVLNRRAEISYLVGPAVAG